MTMTRRREGVSAVADNPVYQTSWDRPAWPNLKVRVNNSDFYRKVRPTARFPKPIRFRNNEAAKWRIRSNVRSSTYIKLNEHGSLAVTSAGSLLNYSETAGVKNFTSYSRWKPTLESSNMFKAIRGERQRGIFRNCKRKEYKRMESALKSLGQMICLSVEDLEDKELLVGWAHLKRWAVEEGMGPNQDRIIESLKWLAKTCQAIFLEGDIPEQVEFYNIPIEGESLLPFCGQLQFISDLYFGKRLRSTGFKYMEAKAISQVGNYARAAPYPSEAQIVTSVKKTMLSLTDVCAPPNSRALRRHSKATMELLSRCKRNYSTTTHMSLSNSGSYDNPKSKDGKSGLLVKNAKVPSDAAVDLRLLDSLVGRVDCLGVEILKPITLLLAKQQLVKDPDLEFLMGDVMYTEPLALARALKRRNESKNDAPLQLAWVILNTSSLMMLEYGHYDNNPQVIAGMLTFDPKYKGVISRFRMGQNFIPVRGSISIEAGLKSRLVTSAPAAVTQIGQLVGNYVRKTLSSDPFMRIGFEEADKLWSLLKTYGRNYANKSKSN